MYVASFLISIAGLMDEVSSGDEQYCCCLEGLSLQDFDDSLTSSHKIGQLSWLRDEQLDPSDDGIGHVPWCFDNGT